MKAKINVDYDRLSRAVIPGKNIYRWRTTVLQEESNVTKEKNFISTLVGNRTQTS